MAIVFVFVVVIVDIDAVHNNLTYALLIEAFVFCCHDEKCPLIMPPKF